MSNRNASLASPQTDPTNTPKPAQKAHHRLSRSLTASCCLTCPHTPVTENLFDAAAFAAMKPGASLVNIARGEAAMIAALESGRLKHAALDEVAIEPLPPESPLWDMPNVSIYRHSASTNDRENQRSSARTQGVASSINRCSTPLTSSGCVEQLA